MGGQTSLVSKLALTTVIKPKRKPNKAVLTRSIPYNVLKMLLAAQHSFYVEDHPDRIYRKSNMEAISFLISLDLKKRLVLSCNSFGN